jgi:hypothetical protein
LDPPLAGIVSVFGDFGGAALRAGRWTAGLARETLPDACFGAMALLPRYDAGMSEPTTAKLAAALSEIPGVPRAMITRAIDGYYHDYMSPLAFPEMQLAADLLELAKLPATPRNSRPLLRAMVDRVKDGDFDASKEESDAWAASPDGQETFRQLRDDAVFGGIARAAEHD